MTKLIAQALIAEVYYNCPSKSQDFNLIEAIMKKRKMAKAVILVEASPKTTFSFTIQESNVFVYQIQTQCQIIVPIHTTTQALV